MTPRFTSLIRRAAPILVLVGTFLLALALAPIGQALWNKVLTVDGQIRTAEPPPPAAAAAGTVEYVSVGASCEAGGTIWAELRNGSDLTTPKLTVELLYLGAGVEPEPDLLVATEVLDQLEPGMADTMLLSAAEGSGRYVFQVPTLDSEVPESIRSEEVEFDLDQCTTTSDPPPEDPPAQEPPAGEEPPPEDPPADDPPPEDPPGDEPPPEPPPTELPPPEEPPTP